MIQLHDIDFDDLDISEDRLTLIKTGIRDLLQEVLTAGQRAERDKKLRGATDAEHRLIERIVHLYRRNPAYFAEICDKQLDRSGNLLGYVRDAVREQQQ